MSSSASLVVFFDTRMSVLIYMSLFVYVLGLFGLLFSIKNIFISLLFIEMTYFGLICYFLIFGIFMGWTDGFGLALLLILIAAAESVIGLGLVIVTFKYQRNISYETLKFLRV